MDHENEALRQLLHATQTRPGGDPERRRLVADAAGCNPDNLYQIAAGVLLPSGKPRSLGRETREKLDAAFPGWRDAAQHQSLGSERGYTEPRAGYVRLPVLASASAGPGLIADVDEVVEHVEVLESWVRQTLRSNPKKLQVLTARGSSMRGQVEDGDVMFVEPCTGFERDGLYIIAVGDLLRVKRLRVLLVDERLSIESNDGSAPELLPLAEANDRLRICGQVVAAWTLTKF